MRQPLLMLDLCCGLKGASAAMRERGWDVISVDNDSKFSPDVVADVRTWTYEGRRPDLVWSSPPCTEFSRESMPWTRRGVVPDMSIVDACVRVSRDCGTRFWLLENTRGAIKWFRPLLGEPVYRMSPQFLWGSPPVAFQPAGVKMHKKQHGTPELRAMVPWHISLALARAVELDAGDRRRRPQRAGDARGEQLAIAAPGPQPASAVERGRIQAGPGDAGAAPATLEASSSAAPTRARSRSVHDGRGGRAR